MKIYRGPSTKQIWDELPDEVDTKDLSGSLKSWTDNICIRVNITKDGTERQAVAYFVLEESDVVSLYQTLVQGWKEKARALEKSADEVSSLKKTIESIRDAVSDAELDGEKETLSKITSIVNNALKNK